MKSIHVKISHSTSDGDTSDGSEGENRELALIDQESRRRCRLPPFPSGRRRSLEPAYRVRMVFHGLDCGSSREEEEEQEELERINQGLGLEKRARAQPSRPGCHGDASSSDEEVKALCGLAFRPVSRTGRDYSPLASGAAPHKRLHPLARRPTGQASILEPLDQALPRKRHQHSQGEGRGRPSLDLEKMQQNMFLKKNCEAKT